MRAMAKTLLVCRKDGLEIQRALRDVRLPFPARLQSFLRFKWRHALGLDLPERLKIQFASDNPLCGAAPKAYGIQNAKNVAIKRSGNGNALLQITRYSFARKAGARGSRRPRALDPRELCLPPASS